MSALILGLFAAAGLLIGWAAGSAVAARRVRQRREWSSMQQFHALTRALARTASPKSGDR
jgi:hypothetical protein